MGDAASIERARLAFAERLRQLADVRSPALVRAFATVARERFMGPGPWKILVPPEFLVYRDTPDGDPRHLYDNVLVALDEGRRLNNGEPAALARWLDALALTPGDRFLHIGCGVGYYTAVVAETVTQDGSALGIEIDAELAEHARRNLAGYANVTVARGDGSQLEAEAFDAVLVNAGATDIPPVWLDCLRPGGRLLVPLTVGAAGFEAGFGQMLLVTRYPRGYAARFVSGVGVFHCAGARSADGEARLADAYARDNSGTVHSLRRDAHAAGSACWLHAPQCCLSTRAVPQDAPAQPAVA
jgi:protein-L-isoaspartate(D-aspartate) O-methyltransferase